MRSEITERFMVITMIRMTGYIYDENDDMAPVMDAILRRLGFGVTYGKEDDGEWMSRVNHRDMQDALEDMTETEREIVRKFFMERKTLLDISIEMNLPMDMVGGYIKTLKARFMIWA